jgi:hypothetical protein
LSRASLLRSAPFELPQGGNEARVEGCSGAIKGACPFFTFSDKVENGFSLNNHKAELFLTSLCSKANKLSILATS